MTLPMLGEFRACQGNQCKHEGGSTWCVIVPSTALHVHLCYADRRAIHAQFSDARSARKCQIAATPERDTR